MLSLLVACGGGVTLSPLPKLHLRGVNEIEGIETLPGPFSAVATYVASEHTAGVARPIRVLLEADESSVYDVGIDGTLPDELPLRCDGAISVSPDGRWMACQYEQELAILFPPGVSEQVGVSARDVLPHTTYLSDTTDGPITYPAWAPDGRILAAVTHRAGCSIAFYTPPVGGVGAVHLLATLTLPAFEPQPDNCTVTSLSWSPDGHWLAFAGRQHGAVSRTLYGLSPTTLIPHLMDDTGQTRASPTTRMVAMSDVQQWGNISTLMPPSWIIMPSGLAVTFVSDDQTIVQVDTQTGQRRQLLHVPEGRVSSLAWTPDGHTLVFIHSKVACLECQPGPPPSSRLYTYIPNSAT